MIRGALINATAFVGGSYFAKYLSGAQNGAEEEKKRHGLTVRKYQVAYEKYKIEQSFSIRLQLVTKSRSGQNRVLLIRIML